MSTLAIAKIFMKDMPIPVKLALYFTIIAWAVWGFKKVEPAILPVVDDFYVTKSEDMGNSKRISGVMTKVRGCDFLELIAYSNDNLVSVVFGDRELDNERVVSRVEGKQSWGWWIVTPSVADIAIYSKHSCLTGKVITKLWEGEI